MAFLFSGLYEAIPDIDFIPLNYYACMAETSPVTQGIIVEMFTDKGTGHTKARSGIRRNAERCVSCSPAD